MNPEYIILVGSPHWDQDLHLVAADPLQGFNNIMYTLHFYAATHKQELRDRATGCLGAGGSLFSYRNVPVWNVQVTVHWTLKSGLAG